MTEHHTTSEEDAQVEERAFQTEVQQVLQILVHSLYTDKDVFLRELVSNASDALDKIRFRSLTDQGIVDPRRRARDRHQRRQERQEADHPRHRHRHEPRRGEPQHRHHRPLRVAGSFLERLSAEQDEEQRLKLIGQFGVGFYSVFMIAERVVLTTRSADPDAEAVVWESTGDGSYTVATTRDKTDRGTEIQIFVRSDCEEYLNAHRLEGRGAPPLRLRGLPDQGGGQAVERGLGPVGAPPATRSRRSSTRSSTSTSPATTRSRWVLGARGPWMCRSSSTPSSTCRGSRRWSCCSRPIPRCASTCT